MPELSKEFMEAADIEANTPIGMGKPEISASYKKLYAASRIASALMLYVDEHQPCPALVAMSNLLDKVINSCHELDGVE